MMRSNRSPLFACIVVVALTSSVRTQESSGFTMYSEAAVTFESDADCVVTRDPGLREDYTATVTPGAPDFSTLPPTQASPQVGIQAMSIGVETIVVSIPLNNFTQAFVEISPDHGWVEMMFAVRADELSAGSSTRALFIEDKRGHAGGGLYSYVMPLSSLELIPDEKTTNRVLGAAESKVVSQQILAVDFNMALYQLDEEFTTSSFISKPLPALPTFYFTVTNPNDVPTSWWNHATRGATAPSSATILKTAWNGSTWSTPEPSVVYDELSLGGVLLGSSDAIDGLAVDAQLQHMVISLSRDTSSRLGYSTPETEVLFVAIGDTDPVTGGSRLRRYMAAREDTSTTPPTIVSQPLGELVGADQAVGDFCIRDPGSRQNPTIQTTLATCSIAIRGGVHSDAHAGFPAYETDLRVAGYRVPAAGAAPIAGAPRAFRTVMQGPKVKGRAAVRFGLTSAGTDAWLSSWMPMPYGGRPVSREFQIDPVQAQIDGVECIFAQWRLIDSDSNLHVGLRCVLEL